MSNWLIYALIFWGGIISGFLIKSWMMYKFMHYSGALVIVEEAEKKIYTLELFDEVENLDNQDHVIFKVHTKENDES